MGAQHKPPLYAFVVVMLVGAMVMTYAARSEAFRQEMLQRTVVVAGSVLDRAPVAPAPAATEIVIAAPAVAPPAAVPPVAQTADRQRPAASGQQVAAERDHRAAKPGHGHAQQHAQPHAQAQPAAPDVKDPSPGPGKDDAPGLIQALDHVLAQAPGLLTAPGLTGKDDGADKAKGDKAKGNNGKAKGKDKAKGNNGKAKGNNGKAKGKNKGKAKGHGKKG